MNLHLDASFGRINTLRKELIPAAIKVVEKCHSLSIPIYIIWAHRTVEEQDLLYRYGRSMPGLIQTTRRGGFSAHNYGLAIDFCLIKGNDFISWNEVYLNAKWRSKWFKAALFFQEEGWETGWRWPAFEPGHAQNLLGNTLLELYEQDTCRNNRK